MTGPCGSVDHYSGEVGLQVRIARFGGALAAQPYMAHPLHTDPTSDWIDNNCYADLWIELLHSVGLDPHPCLVSTLALDFEADQWTFFKPAQEDLRLLYGIEIVELAIYEPLATHAANQVGAQRVPLIEVDAFFLPDVVTTYRQAHSKTTIAVVDVDLDTMTAGYLHNSGYFRLAGDDFRGAFQVGTVSQGLPLAPYVESVKFTGLRRAEPGELAATAARLAAGYLDRRDPGAMPRFRERLGLDSTRVATEPPAWFDGWAFSTLRQLGAGSSLAARLLRWFGDRLGADLASPAGEFDAVSAGVKRLLLKSARCAARRRTLDATDLLDEITASWQRAYAALADPRIFERVPT